METTPLLGGHSKGYKSWAYAVTIVGCLCSASFTCFSLYTAQFASELYYNPGEINAIIVAASIGLYAVVPFIGVLADTIRLSIVAISAGVLYAVGYLSAYLCYISRSSYVWMALSFVLVAIGTSGCYIICVVNAARLQKDSALWAIALPTTCYGASTLIFSQIIDRLPFFQGSRGLNVPLVFGTLSLFTFLVGIATAVAPILGESDCPLSREIIERDPEEAEPPVIHVSHMRRFIYTHQTWLLLLTFVCASGPLEIYMNNLGAISHTTEPEATTSTQIALFSSFSTLSRLAMGAYLDYANRNNKPSLLLLVSLLILAATHLTLSKLSLTPSLLSVLSCLSGWVYGSFFTLYPVIITRVWGSAGFATYWSIFVAAPALGTLIYGSLFAYFYQSKGNWQPSFGVSVPVLLVCIVILYRLQSRWTEN